MVIPMIVGVILLVVTEIWATNRLATYGLEISGLQQSKTAIILENQLLENEIAQKSSLLNIETSSKDLGFGKISNLEYIKPPNLAANF